MSPRVSAPQTNYAKSPSPDSTSQLLPTTRLYFAGYHLWEISFHNGMPSFSADGESWIKAQTGEYANFPKLGVATWQTLQHTHDLALPTVTNPEMPERKITEKYFSLFCSAMHLVFPIVDPVLFEDTINTAYEPCKGPPSPARMSAQACVLSFLSNVSLMEGNLEMMPIDGNVCATKALSLIQQALLDTTITGLQALFMQGMFYMFSGDFQTASKFHSLACRAMFILGAHTLADECPPHVSLDEADRSWRVKVHLRQPPAINDDYCDLTFPRCYQTSLSGFICERDGMPSFPGELRLSLIKSKSSKLLYSAEALHKSDAELLRHIRELDDELERWRLSIDPKFRPTFSSCPNKCVGDPEASGSQKMLVLFASLEYYYLIATMHQAMGRCHAWARDKNGGSDAVRSSLALSVEASRSTLILLRAGTDSLLGESFWMIVLYPISASLTIFFNILLNPLSARAEEDLDLLRGSSGLIKCMRARRLTPNEILHISMIEEFVEEMTRLGTCAIAKAHR
ncbi:hypothetical protein N7465_010164 [Penicillium sp. CMV-2018d]|nr:hypothetical protein N7465_010164 [Penicillium sp. CMV-2018d]